METFLKFTPYILYGLGLIGVGFKSYYDIQNLRERMKETETQLKDYSLLQSEIKTITTKVIEHDTLLNKMSVDIAKIGENINFIKVSIERLQK